MPRNVVTVLPRRVIVPWRSSHHERQAELLDGLAASRQVRPRDDGGVEIDFPMSLGRREARDRVTRELDALDHGWRRLLRVYPTDSAIRQSEGSG